MSSLWTLLVDQCEGKFGTRIFLSRTPSSSKARARRRWSLDSPSFEDGKTWTGDTEQLVADGRSVTSLHTIFDNDRTASKMDKGYEIEGRR